ncbi:MAG TPA: hypothetical protein VI566_01755 [Xanthomonadales bacterium]|nr:hypothetical protein [Xanthomonadales bacterium]
MRAIRIRKARKTAKTDRQQAAKKAKVWFSGLGDWGYLGHVPEQPVLRRGQRVSYEAVVTLATETTTALGNPGFFSCEQTASSRDHSPCGFAFSTAQEIKHVQTPI